jgi:hypothetical protein
MVIHKLILLSQQNWIHYKKKKLFCIPRLLISNLVCLILEAEFPFSCCLSHCLPPSSVCRLKSLWQYHCHLLLCALHFLSDLHYSTCGRILLSDGLWWELKLAWCSWLSLNIQFVLQLDSGFHAAYKLHNSGHRKQYNCKARPQFYKVNLQMSPLWQLSCKQGHRI